MKISAGTIILIVLVVSAFLFLAYMLRESAANSGRKKMHIFRKKSHDDDIFHILAPSLLGAAICVVCLCGASWAWYTASVSAGAMTIQSASYTVNATVTQRVTNAEMDTPSAASDAPTVTKNGIITNINFTSAGSYTVTLTPAGTAHSGYCKVTLGEKVYYTQQVIGEPYSFTFLANANETLQITPEWGTCSITEEAKIIKAGGVICDGAALVNAAEEGKNPVSIEEIAQPEPPAEEQPKNEPAAPAEEQPENESVTPAEEQPENEPAAPAEDEQTVETDFGVSEALASADAPELNENTTLQEDVGEAS